jgi:hypothetical protein
MNHQVLTDEQTLDAVIDCVLEHVSIDMQGECAEETVFRVLVRAASTNESIEHTAQTLANAPDGGTIRDHVEKRQNMTALEDESNAALQSRLPGSLTKHAQRMALDLNLQPYYGTPSSEERPYSYRSQVHDGTCSFYAYAPCYVSRKGKRVTIALTPVRRDDLMVGMITRLLDRVNRLGVSSKRVYLDRGFYSVPVIWWLQACDVPFEMPVILRGKTGGTRQLLQRGKSYKTQYTMTSQTYGTVTFAVGVVRVYSNGKHGKHGREYSAYAVYKVSLGLRALSQDYRWRFGIESSYRLKNTCRIRTTMKKPVVRLLFVGSAFLVIDL